jgi:hypothetical protein
MIYRYHCIRDDGFNYAVSPYFVDLARGTGINIVGIWKIKEYRRYPAPEPSIFTSMKDAENYRVSRGMDVIRYEVDPVNQLITSKKLK